MSIDEVIQFCAPNKKRTNGATLRRSFSKLSRPTLIMNYIESFKFIVFKQPWGEHEWDKCSEGKEQECAGWHGANLIGSYATKNEAERQVKILNGWD